jgi:hypothetical protein
MPSSPWQAAQSCAFSAIVWSPAAAGTSSVPSKAIGALTAIKKRRDRAVPPFARLEAGCRLLRVINPT